ncbi:S41 family peptidase [Anditalea andensis]|uniref:Carboxyl-terminal protease n=1 Tax=Anditalea andensis TaxID=1048983 RepID=A0A074L1Z4_9BACT|nr:S41 family peptidase [Anditalea andensis]KEO73893.1 carboxyl-terminal protease [Anditalea andensis]
MNKLSSLLINIISLVLIVTVLSSCNEEVEDAQTIPQTEDKVKLAIFESMKEWYFWTDQLPETINVSQYSSNDVLLDGIIHKPLDRWSYLTTQDAFYKAFTGQNAGHGFGWGLDENEHLYILFVYDASPAGKDGWKRGWRVLEINNKPISQYKTASGYDFQIGPNTPGLTNSFKFKLPDGSETVRTIDKQDYQSNSVLLKTVFESGNKKIGYWVYNSFRASPNAQPANSMSFEVDETFNYFESKQINELIIDLRYNGGGSIAVTQQILNYLVPSAANGGLMYTNTHNLKKANQNNSATFAKKGQLNLPRLFIITSRSSASASELLINVLEPYMEVILIGANTYGKPVGSFPLSSYNRTLRENNVELVPITFSIANRNGRAEYFDGFPVHVAAADDPSKNWGDPTERRFKAAIDYIITGAPISHGGRMLTYQPHWEMIDDFRGLLKEFPAY